jgi:hypothetical protein
MQVCKHLHKSGHDLPLAASGLQLTVRIPCSLSLTAFIQAGVTSSFAGRAAMLAGLEASAQLKMANEAGQSCRSGGIGHLYKRPPSRPELHKKAHPSKLRMTYSVHWPSVQRLMWLTGELRRTSRSCTLHCDARELRTGKSCCGMQLLLERVNCVGRRVELLQAGSTEQPKN